MPEAAQPPPLPSSVAQAGRPLGSPPQAHEPPRGAHDHSVVPPQHRRRFLRAVVDREFPSLSASARSTTDAGGITRSSSGAGVGTSSLFIGA